MKKLVLFIALIVLGISSNNLLAQGGPDQKFLNAGVGLSGWGVPIYANFEFPIANDFTLSVGGSYQSRVERYYYLPGQRIGWRHNILGLQIAGNYYFDNLIDLPSDFDLYAGIQAEYYVWRTRLVDNKYGTVEYSGSGLGGAGISGLIGGRYHVKPGKLSLNLQLAGGTVMSAGRLGVSFWL
ncbi:MAG: hypothetical protein R2809_02750 [Flavobacteriales bacterium]